MNKPIDEEVVKEFVNLIIDDVKNRYGENCDYDKIVYHLIDKGILQTSLVRNYLIIRNYHTYQTTKNSTLNNYCFVMEEKFKLTSRQIHNIIGKYFKRFFINSHIVPKISDGETEI